MRLSSSLFQCCALLGCASAQQGFLYAFETDLRDDAHPTIVSSDTALSILAGRHGITDGFSLQGVDEHTLADISRYGGYQEPLFGDLSNPHPARVFVRIVGHSFDYKDDMSSLLKPAVSIQHPSTDLLSAFKTVAVEEAGLSRYETRTRDGVKFSYALSSSTSCTSAMSKTKSSDQPLEQIIEFFKKAGFYNNMIKPLCSFATFDVDFSEAKPSSQHVNSQIFELIMQLNAMYTVDNLVDLWTIQPTLLLLPSLSELAKPSHHGVLRRQLNEEEPLDLEPVTSTSSEPSTFKSNTTYPLPSRIPACFSSKSACTNATNACSGHGTCALSTHGSKCYTCHCTRTVVRTNADGSKKTIAWGGAACQKKDISVPFFLFAGFGIFMAALISGSIGMLYTMGSEQLPSVIGAGVAGVSRK